VCAAETLLVLPGSKSWCDRAPSSVLPLTEYVASTLAYNNP
jgi:hypothetical protein